MKLIYIDSTSCSLSFSASIEFMKEWELPENTNRWMCTLTHFKMCMASSTNSWRAPKCLHKSCAFIQTQNESKQILCSHKKSDNCLFVFAPVGTIVMCLINAPGTIHNSTMVEWGGVYMKLETIYERTGGKCVVDSAFSKSQNFGCLIKSAQSIIIKT
jgi:hypothetical protein